MNEKDMPVVMTYEELSADRDWWREKYFELMESSGEMIKILAGRYVMKDLHQNHAADEIAHRLSGWEGPL